MTTEYRGRALVVAIEPLKEGDAIVTLFTGDLGLVKAKVVSFRTMRSRLRLHLSLGSLTDVILVNGYDFYRLKGSIEDSASRPVLKVVEKVSLLGQILTLLERYLHGPLPAPYLYEATLDLYQLLSDLNLEQLRQLSSRILVAYHLALFYELGYQPKLSFWSGEEPVNFRELVKQLVPLPNLQEAQNFLKNNLEILP